MLFLGNLSIKELEERTGYKFSDEDKNVLERHRQDKADVEINSDKFHIFDMPFQIHVGVEFKEELLIILLKYEKIKPSKTPLKICIA